MIKINIRDYQQLVLYVRYYHLQWLTTRRETLSVISLRGISRTDDAILKIARLKWSKTSFKLACLLFMTIRFYKVPADRCSTNSYFKIPCIIYIFHHKNLDYLLSKRESQLLNNTQVFYSLETSAKASRRKIWLVKYTIQYFTLLFWPTNSLHR